VRRNLAAKGVCELASESGYGYSGSLTYDSLSRPATVAYPTGLTVQTSYTAYGQLSKLSNASTGADYWQAVNVDARGNVTGATYGNGVNLSKSFDAATGRLTGILSTSAAAGTIQNLSYQFDTLGNLLSRTDSIQAIVETFQYDTLNRVTASTVRPTGQGSGGTTVSVAYDALGNITSKSDIGAYTYGPGAACGNTFAGPHAVSAVAGTKNANYCYDNNGNLTEGDGRTVAWTAFNMPSLIQQNARQVALTYGPGRGRFKRVDLNETGTSTTYYVAGGSHEVIESGTTVTHKTYIGGAAVVIEVTSAPASTETIYLLHDHLGSTDVITAADGTVQTRYSFDAWGRRRDVT
jgi:YD repeat-containing protein